MTIWLPFEESDIGAIFKIKGGNVEDTKIFQVPSFLPHPLCFSVTEKLMGNGSIGKQNSATVQHSLMQTSVYVSK